MVGKKVYSRVRGQVHIKKAVQDIAALQKCRQYWADNLLSRHRISTCRSVPSLSVPSLTIWHDS